MKNLDNLTLASEYHLVMGGSYVELFEDLGFLDCPLLPRVGDVANNISNEVTLGWAAKVITKGHVIFEVGDDKHHVRIDMKESWIGHRLVYQIDQMTLWDDKNKYDIACGEGSDRRPLDEIIGTVDIAVQGLQNGDYEEADHAFKDIHRIKEEFRFLIGSHNVTKRSSRPNTP